MYRRRNIILIFIVLLSVLLVFRFLRGPAQNETVHIPLSSSMTITSSAFPNGATIPREYTCEGSNAIPPLAIHDVPAGTKSFALVTDDPDAPDGTFLHWTV